MFEILEQITEDGKRPFADWLLNLKDKSVQVKIRARIARASLGNFGGWKSLENTNGLYEMRVHYGAGFRVFYKLVGNKVVLLLADSTKDDQNRTIAKAKEYLADYERRTTYDKR